MNKSRFVRTKKKAVKFRSAGTKFLTKNKFSFQFITSLAKFRRHIRCTEIFAAFQLAFESRRISCRRFSLSIHTLIYTHVFSTFEKEWFNRFGIPIGSLGYLGHVPLWKIIAQQQTLSLQGNYVMENRENSSSLRTSRRQQVRKTNDKLTLRLKPGYTCNLVNFNNGNQWTVHDIVSVPPFFSSIDVKQL